MSTPKPGSIAGTPQEYIRIGEIEWGLMQQGIFASDMTLMQRQALIHYARQPGKSVASCVEALALAWGQRTAWVRYDRNIATHAESMSGSSSSTTRRWVDVPLF